MNLFNGDFEGLSSKWRYYFRKPILKFHDRKEARRIENLHHLFSLCVKRPFLLPFLPWLIRLPLGWLYFSSLKLAHYILEIFLSEDYRPISFNDKVKRVIYYLTHVR